MDVLTSPKYNDILSVRFFYDMTTDELISESQRIGDQVYEIHQTRAPQRIQTSYRRGYLRYRSLGTIRQHKAEKRKLKQKEPSDDVILRILRMRSGTEKYLRERFIQKNKLAATVAAEGILRRPRG
jgi:hypothetical protein